MHTDNLNFVKYDLETAKRKLGVDLITAAYVSWGDSGTTYWITKFRSKWTGRLQDGTYITEGNTLRACAIGCSRTEEIALTKALKEIAKQPKTVKALCTVYAVRDSHGKVATYVCDDPSDTVQICGLAEADGNALYFESNGYNLNQWCETHGLTITAINTHIEITV